MTAFQPLLNRLLSQTILQLPQPPRQKLSQQKLTVKGIIKTPERLPATPRDITELYTQLFEFRCVDPSVPSIRVFDILRVTQTDSPLVRVDQNLKVIYIKASTAKIAQEKAGIKLLLGVSEMTYFENPE